MEFKDSKTYKNLVEAFCGESIARNKYNFYASKAKKEGYEQISAFFEETAHNEKEHAKLWFKAMHGGDIPSTTENLTDAAAGEYDEWYNMYKRMAKEAREEGYEVLATQFEGVAKIESEHEKRYRDLLKNIETKCVFTRDSEVTWRCRNCGHTYFGKNAPIVCPVCNHPQSYFELICENY